MQHFKVKCGKVGCIFDLFGLRNAHRGALCWRWCLAHTYFVHLRAFARLQGVSSPMEPTRAAKTWRACLEPQDSRVVRKTIPVIRRLISSVPYAHCTRQIRYHGLQVVSGLLMSRWCRGRCIGAREIHWKLAGPVHDALGGWLLDDVIGNSAARLPRSSMMTDTLHLLDRNFDTRVALDNPP